MPRSTTTNTSVTGPKLTRKQRTQQEFIDQEEWTHEVLLQANKSKPFVEAVRLLLDRLQEVVRQHEEKGEKKCRYTEAEQYWHSWHVATLSGAIARRAGAVRDMEMEFVLITHHGRRTK